MFLTIDGQQVLPLMPGDEVALSGSEALVRFVRVGRKDFFKTVRHKFKLP